MTQNLDPLASHTGQNRLASVIGDVRVLDRKPDDQELERYLASFERQTHEIEHFRLTRSVVRLARSWRKIANERIRGLGQTMARWESLFHVAYSDQALTQNQLAKMMCVEGPTVTGMLEVLARDGLISRTQSHLDRRVTTNKITPKGELVIEAIMERTNLLRAAVLADIAPEKLAICNEVLASIMDKIEAARSDGEAH